MAVNTLKALPSPKGWPIIGTLAELIAAGGAPKLHEYVDKRHKQLGPIYREKIGPVEGVFVSSPEYMRRVFALEGRNPKHIIPESWDLYNQTYGQKRGLLFMDGEEWNKFRKVLNGIILKPESKELVDAVAVAADDLIATWTRDGRTMDLENQLYKWSLQSILSVLLGSETYKTWSVQLEPQIEELSKKLHGILVESANLSLIPAKLAKRFHLPPWTRFVQTVDSAFQSAEILLETLHNLPSSSSGLFKQLQDTKMSTSDLNRIVMDLVLAAGDTTAFTTQWLLYLIANHPNLQEEMFNEINNQDLMTSVQNHLIKGALRETLRLYPVAPFITRYMPEDSDIDGYHIKKGDLIIMSLFSSGRNEENFPDSLEFQPGRWTRHKTGYEGVKNPQASIPFAMGARSCIGRKIAETQIQITLVKIMKNMRVERLSKGDIDVKLHLIAVPAKPIELKMCARK